MKALATFYLTTTLVYMIIFIVRLIGNFRKPITDTEHAEGSGIDWELLNDSPFEKCEGCKTMLLEFDKKQGFCSTCGQPHNLN
ncbi:hypothetical protein [Jiulongibacter sp. NS-SX5]|uniref:hypothetical protein n=1 Tax=Jiulongibacter sp. NS-SX5 TaxID=3463854 RepID=UPI004059F0E3